MLNFNNWHILLHYQTHVDPIIVTLIWCLNSTYYVRRFSLLCLNLLLRKYVLRLGRKLICTMCTEKSSSSPNKPDKLNTHDTSTTI